MNQPINMSGNLPHLTVTSGGGNAAATGGAAGGFAALIGLLGQVANPQGGSTQGGVPQQTSGGFFNFEAGELTASLDTAELPQSLSDLAELLGLKDVEEPNPESPAAGLPGQLADLLNSMAGKLELNAEVDPEAAEAALRLAKGLIQQAGGPPASIEANQPQQTLAAQMRAVAADLDLMRHNIPFSSARTDAAAIFNGTAPTLEDLLNPQNANGQTAKGAGQADTTRLADTIGANLAAKAGATANQPAPGTSGAQTLAAALAESGVNANVTAQTAQAATNAQAEPLPTAQVTATGAPTLSSDVSAAARPMQAAYQAPQINMQQLAFHIASQFQAGNSRFQIRMDPPELGRIDVRMDVDANGAIHARLTVDRAETLEMLRQDSRLLERALQQAGLDQSKTNLEFSLRQGGADGEPGDADTQTAEGESPQSVPIDETIPIAATLNAYQGMASPSGLNLWV